MVLYCVKFVFLVAFLTSHLIVAEECQSITLEERLNTSCQPLVNCSGLYCNNVGNTSHIWFTVHNCEDPVLVNTTFHRNGSFIFNRVFNDSSSISINTGQTFVWNMSRNASHLFVQATLVNSKMHMVLVPHVTIGLNPTGCMCESINAIADRGVSPFDTQCVNNTECTGLECTFDTQSFGTQSFGTYRIETEVQSCATPPGFVFLVRNVESDAIIFDQYFDSSRNATINFKNVAIPLHVKVHHRKYSIIISILAVVYGQRYYLVPESQIILDKSHCGPNINTTIPIPSPTPSSPTDPKICNSLTSIANQPQSQCTTNAECDGLICNILNYKGQFQILPCNDPPGLHVTLRDENNEVIYDNVITNTTTIPLSEALELSLVVYFHKIRVDTLELQVVLETNLGNVTVVPKTEISYDHCLCLSDASDCSTAMTFTSTHIHLSTLSPSSTSTPASSSSSTSTPAVAKSKGYITIIEIVSPIIFVSVIIISSAVFVICFLLVWKKKRSSQISFHRLSVQVDDDDNADL